MSLSEYIQEGIRHSLRERFKERRTKLDIMADILAIASEEAKKTKVAYSANLNFTRLSGYLPYLVDKGLIEKTDWGYKTTEKGKEFLRDYHVMQKLLT